MRIGVLNNLRAGRSRRITGRLLAALRPYPDVLHLETNRGAMVPDAMAEFAAAGVELIVANGGDGTVHRILTEVLGSDEPEWLPLVAPLRGGSTNCTAKNIGASRDAVRGLVELIESVRMGRLAERIVSWPVLRVELGSSAPVYGMTFAAGVLSRAVQLSHENFPRGSGQGLGAAMVTASLLARLAVGRQAGVMVPDKMEIWLDEAVVGSDEFSVVLATTVERFFLGLRPFWGTEDAPVRMTAIASRARGLTSAIPGLLRGRPPAHATPEAGFTSRNVESAALRLDCGVMLDGELFPGRPACPVRIRADHRARFVRA